MNVTAEGWLKPGQSTSVPKIFSGADSWGFINSEEIPTTSASDTFRVSWNADVPNNSNLLVKVRGSSDGNTWTEYRSVHISGDTVVLPKMVNYVQYNVTMAGSGKNIPVFKDFHIDSVQGYVAPQSKVNTFIDTAKKPDLKAASSTVSPMSAMVAPNTASPMSALVSFSSSNCATREGLIGGTTANGHVIKSTDVFVALPSTAGLCPSTSSCSYTVNLTNGTKSINNVPVWDVGPWDIHDDYWNNTRDSTCLSGWGFPARGNAEAWSAINSAYHDGYSTTHPKSGSVGCNVDSTHTGTQVNAATGLTQAEIDLSDGVWSALGMVDNGYISVTFNWVTQ